MPETKVIPSIILTFNKEKLFSVVRIHRVIQPS